MTSGAPQADDVEELVVAVASGVTRRLAEVTDGMRGTLADAIAELVGDHRLLDLLGEAIEGNLGTVLAMLRERVPLRELTVPGAAVIHARRLAQQGVPVFAMVRAYRLGQAYLLEECFVELGDGRVDPALALRAYNAINLRTLSYIDWVSQQVVGVYETERDQWVRHQDAARAAQVRALLDADSGGPDPDAEAALRYRLGQHHVAALVWSEQDTDPDSFSRVETAVSTLAAAVDGAGEPLVVAADRATTWVWFPRGDDDADVDVALLDRALRSATRGVLVALGTAAPGVEGFRRSHRQAVDAAGVLAAGERTARRSVGYGEPGVPAAALLARDPDRTRRLVHAVLGPLAAADPATERLRGTLLSYLEAGSSHAVAAARLTLHKNSVRYRVERALELRGRPLGDDRIDVELALLACRWLPSACLGPAAPPA